MTRPEMVSMVTTIDQPRVPLEMVPPDVDAETAEKLAEYNAAKIVREVDPATLITAGIIMGVAKDYEAAKKDLQSAAYELSSQLRQRFNDPDFDEREDTISRIFFYFGAFASAPRDASNQKGLIFWNSVDPDEDYIVSHEGAEEAQRLANIRDMQAEALANRIAVKIMVEMDVETSLAIGLRAGTIESLPKTLQGIELATEAIARELSQGNAQRESVCLYISELLVSYGASLTAAPAAEPKKITKI